MNSELTGSDLVNMYNRVQSTVARTYADDRVQAALRTAIDALNSVGATAHIVEHERNIQNAQSTIDRSRQAIDELLRGTDGSGLDG